MKLINALLVVFSLALNGCEEPMDFSNHFWQNVDGSYESKETGTYIDKDRTTKEMQWAYPLKVGKPYFCFISCEQIKTYSIQDFSQEAPGLYKKNEWPF